MPVAQREPWLMQLAKRDRQMHEELVSLLAYATAEDEPDEFEPTPAPTPNIARYVLLERIGRGGMGTVYRGRREDGAFEHKVAVKILRRGLDTDDVLKRFQAERQILAGLEHPNIARLLDGGSTDDGRPYLVMEYIDGEPIDSYCAQNICGLRQRLRLIQQTCAAVHYAHRNLIVHRDIKPANLLVTHEGVVKLLDFGIAKLLGNHHRSIEGAHTATAMRPMTPSHASPEQIQGLPITTSSDVFSLGVLLFELLTGQRPYSAKSGTRALEQQICETRAPRPSEVVIAGDALSVPTRAQAIPNRSARQMRRALRGDLDTIVSTALRKRPERRYPSVAMLASDIDAYLRGFPIAAHPDSLGYRIGKFLRRHWLASAATAVTLLGVTTLVAVYSLRLEHERNAAQLEASKAREISAFLQQMLRAPSPIASGRDVRVLDVLREAEFKLGQANHMHPQVRDAIALALGDSYSALGQLEQSEQHLDQVLANERARHGADYPGSTDTLYALSRLRFHQGNYPQMVQHNQSIVDALQSKSRSGPAALARAHSELADSLIYAAELAQAREHIAISQRLYKAMPDQQEQRGQNAVNLGRIFDRESDFERAAEANLEGTALLEEALGRNHVLTQNAVLSLASIRAHEERWEDSAALYREVLAVLSDKAGAENFRTTQVASALGSIELRLENFENAERLLNQALNSHLAQLPSQHILLAYDYYYLSELYARTDRLARAEAAAQQSLSISVANLGRDHPDTAYDFVNLGLIQQQRKNLSTARENFSTALAVLAEAYGDDNIRTKEVLQHLINVCEAMSDDTCIKGHRQRLTGTP